jgi:hypothetical protein
MGGDGVARRGEDRRSAATASSGEAWRLRLGRGTRASLAPPARPPARGLPPPPAGVLRRVLLLLVALTVLGVGLFYLGLEYVLKVN